MGLSLEARFEKYCDGLVATLMHADREQPARWYLKGLAAGWAQERGADGSECARPISRCTIWWLKRIGVTSRCCRRWPARCCRSWWATSL